jgi:hypothetical protein
VDGSQISLLQIITVLLRHAPSLISPRHSALLLPFLWRHLKQENQVGGAQRQATEALYG